jgi:hypothetical protein
MQAHPTEPAVRLVARVDAGTDPDVAYAASFFPLTFRLAQQMARAANAAGVDVPERAGSAEWLFGYHAWCLTCQFPALSGQTELPFHPGQGAWPKGWQQCALLEELGAARRAVDAADTLAVAQRAGDGQDVAHALVAYEQASLAYHLVDGHRPAGQADGGAGS